MSRLTVEVNGAIQTFAVTTRGLTIGRALENDIVLQHAFISRRHAAVELRGHQPWVQDLGSRNGLSVNRLRVREAPLYDGDVIEIGPYDLRYEARAAQSVVLDDNKYAPIAMAAGRMVESDEHAHPALDLSEIYRISKRLSSIVGLGELLEAVINEALRIVPAQRGLLLLLKDGDLVPMVISPADHGDMTISSTIARKALEGEAVLTRDARLDFAGSDSIIGAMIRSALCVPLGSAGQVRGLLYLDSPGRDQFGEQERDILVTLATYATLNIDRAQLTEELRFQAQRRQLFERFVSPNIVNEVASYFSQHGRLREPQELVVSVLFADIKDFSTMSERMSPRAVQDLLNEYLHDMSEVIFQHHGTVDKYIGDGIMALFGAPPLTDTGDTRRNAIRAVDTALAMIAAHTALMERLSRAMPRFDFRIGMNTGPVFAGFFGTRQRLEYTAIGDTVNIASRLEGLAAPNTVLISEATRLLIGDLYELAEKGEHQLKGKAMSVRTYQVLGPRAPEA
jgi:adenylate cyclase